jgi:hypothetical protein
VGVDHVVVVDGDIERFISIAHIVSGVLAAQRN